MIWDEIGESDSDRDNMLLQLEQECLDIYRRKVDATRKHKAELCQWLADAEAELINLVSSLGESSSFSRVDIPFCCVVAFAIKTTMHHFAVKFVLKI